MSFNVDHLKQSLTIIPSILKVCRTGYLVGHQKQEKLLRADVTLYWCCTHECTNLLNKVLVLETRIIFYTTWYCCTAVEAVQPVYARYTAYNICYLPLMPLTQFVRTYVRPIGALVTAQYITSRPHRSFSVFFPAFSWTFFSDRSPPLFPVFFRGQLYTTNA